MPPDTRPKPRHGHALARVMAKLGLMSRTIAQQAIEAGRVTVNGRLVREPEAAVDPRRDRLALDGRPVEAAARRYLALNKPRGLITTARDERGRRTVYECLDGGGAWLAPVGRLDRASEGLLLFTNDTAWAQRLLDPASHLPKVYHVQVARHLGEAELMHLSAGVTLPDGQMAHAQEVRLLRQGMRNCWVELTLHQGLNRQIRCMLGALDAEVLRLVRVAIGPIRLADLAKGQVRALTPGELEAMAAMLAAGGSSPRGEGT